MNILLSILKITRDNELWWRGMNEVYVNVKDKWGVKEWSRSDFKR